MSSCVPGLCIAKAPAVDTTALTHAWLDAVYRARSPAYQHFIQQVPQGKPSRADRTLSDAIESGLQDAGVKPLPTTDQVQPASASEATSASTAHVDRLA
jgi:hypothetical protein